MKVTRIVTDAVEAVVAAFLILFLVDLWVANGLTGMLNFWGIALTLVLGYAAMIFVWSTVLEIKRGICSAKARLSVAR